MKKKILEISFSVFTAIYSYMIGKLIYMFLKWLQPFVIELDWPWLLLVLLVPVIAALLLNGLHVAAFILYLPLQFVRKYSHFACHVNLAICAWWLFNMFKIPFEIEYQFSFLNWLWCILLWIAEIVIMYRMVYIMYCDD